MFHLVHEFFFAKIFANLSFSHWVQSVQKKSSKISKDICKLVLLTLGTKCAKNRPKLAMQKSYFSLGVLHTTKVEKSDLVMQMSFGTHIFFFTMFIPTCSDCLCTFHNCQAFCPTVGSACPERVTLIQVPASNSYGLVA